MYNALLMSMSPMPRRRKLPRFADLRTQLIPLVEGIAASGRPADGVLDRIFDVELQERFGRGVIADGF